MESAHFDATTGPLGRLHSGWAFGKWLLDFRAFMSERRIIFLLGAVQFINIMDFMMVMPLGPDFAKALGIGTNHLGLVAGSYTASAAIAGLIGALFLDKFDRRKALFVAMLGLAVGTATGGLSTGLGTMLLARVLAGAFGGPATSSALSILTDVVPPARRGKALGAVMGAFAAASVLGVPAGLELARLGGWRTPFFVIAVAGVAIAAAVTFVMPPMVQHLRAGRLAVHRSVGAFLADPTVLLALGATGLIMGGAFAVIVNLSSYVQFNLGYPREHLGMLYAVGGAVSFFTMRLAGRFVDRRGALQIVIIGTLVVCSVMALSFFPARPMLPIVAMFIGFMTGNSTRVVALNALTTRVPSVTERARFMSAQSAVQHLATAAGATTSAWVLHARPDLSLEGMPILAVGAIATSLVVPVLVAAVATRVRDRDAAAAAAAPPIGVAATVPAPAAAIAGE